MKFLYHRRPGATSIIEIVLVLSVVLFLIGMILPRVLGFMSQLKEDKTRLIMTNVNTAIAMYTNDIGHPPAVEEGGLKALINRPKGPAGNDWRGSYLPGEKNVPQDGWKNNFVYNAPPRKFKNMYKKYELYSMGKDEDDDASDRLRAGE